MVPPMQNIFYLQVLLLNKFEIKVKILHEPHMNDGLRDTLEKTFSQSRNFETFKEHWKFINISLSLVAWFVKWHEVKYNC